MGDHLISKRPGFQPIIYKFIVWTFLGLSLYLCYARSPNYDLTGFFLSFFQHLLVFGTCTVRWFLISIYWFFFFFGEFVGLLPSIISWACRGLDVGLAVRCFFFFFLYRFYFKNFFGLLFLA